MKISELVLRVPDVDRLTRFYRDYLAMTVEHYGDETLVGYPAQEVKVRFTQARAGSVYAHAQNDRYWKIGVTLPNVDIAYQQLVANGVTVSRPRQFQDIGYLCHVTDPAGFIIELLQHDFQGNRRADAGNLSLPLGGGAALGQITLRVTDIDSALREYRDNLGMRLVSIQPVPDHEFTLYFLGFTNETGPAVDLLSVENREWLWRRSWPSLELQCLHAQGAAINPQSSSEAGFSHLVLSDGSTEIRIR